jgi:hypothetical protein
MPITGANMESYIFNIIDYFLKPREWYEYRQLSIDGFRVIATKEEQRQAGLYREESKPAERVRGFGLNPVRPYRDYYGTFILKTRLIPEELEVKFAVGYTLNSKIVTVDDISNFSWLRLCTGMNEILYPNLSHQKQLLDFLLAHSKRPRLIVTRVYQYLQFELYHYLAGEILKSDSGVVAGKSLSPEKK